jgi:hypothetical protein
MIGMRVGVEGTSWAGVRGTRELVEVDGVAGGLARDWEVAGVAGGGRVAGVAWEEGVKGTGTRAGVAVTEVALRAGVARG